MRDELKDYKPYDALDVIDTAREVFFTIVGAAALTLLVYGFVTVFFSL